MPRLDNIELKVSAVSANIAAMVAASPAPTPTLDYAALTGDPPIPSAPPTALKAGSRMCRQGDFATDGFRYWVSRMRQPLQMHRKIWEWFFIADALFQRGQLEPHRNGIGFGVGLEPLSPVFVSRGCFITATDMMEGAAISAGWAGQHAANLDALTALGLCDEATFRRNMSFRVVDMNDIPTDLEGRFDFCWSSCALEHLGSLEHGLRFIEHSMSVLKPGGMAVHTTEFNMSSDTHTFESPGLSLYRRRDLDAVINRLESAGHHVEPMDWDRGSGYADGHVDLPPYSMTPLHLRLRIAEYNCTSIGLIVHKAGSKTT